MLTFRRPVFTEVEEVKTGRNRRQIGEGGRSQVLFEIRHIGDSKHLLDQQSGTISIMSC